MSPSFYLPPFIRRWSEVIVSQTSSSSIVCITESVVQKYEKLPTQISPKLVV